MSRPAICSGCKHYWRPIIPSLYAGAECRRPLSVQFSPVVGDLVETVAAPCANERKAGRTWFGFGRERCGPDGRFFAPLEPVQPPVTPERCTAPKKLKVVK